MVDEVEPTEIDDEFDRCRHGRAASEYCEVCDVDEVDLRDEVTPPEGPADVDVREADSTRDRPS
jgi:hypothetical protein